MAVLDKISTCISFIFISHFFFVITQFLTIMWRHSLALLLYAADDLHAPTKDAGKVSLILYTCSSFKEQMPGSLAGHALHLRRKGLVSCLYATCSGCYITEAANYVIFGNAYVMDNEYD